MIFWQQCSTIKLLYKLPATSRKWKGSEDLFSSLQQHTGKTMWSEEDSVGYMACFQEKGLLHKNQMFSLHTSDEKFIVPSKSFWNYWLHTKIQRWLSVWHHRCRAHKITPFIFSLALCFTHNHLLNHEEIEICNPLCSHAFKKLNITTTRTLVANVLVFIRKY